MQLVYKLQHTATYCNTLQHTAVWNALELPVTQVPMVDVLQHTETCCTTYCNTLQHTATHCYPECSSGAAHDSSSHWSLTLQHAATHCIPLQRTAAHPYPVGFSHFLSLSLGTPTGGHALGQPVTQVPTRLSKFLSPMCLFSRSLALSYAHSLSVSLFLECP